MSGNLKLVCWSGGADSTLVLYEALCEQKVWTQKGKMVGEVRSISFNHPNIPAQVEQRRARVALLREFRRRGLVTRHTEVAIAGRPGPLFENASPIKMPFGSVQRQFWLGFATPYLFDGEDLVIGAHKGELDGAEDERIAFNALQRIGAKKGELAFPACDEPYYAIVRRLRDAKLLAPCWSCEGFDARTARRVNLPRQTIRRAKPCGHCRKCVEFATALWQLRTFPMEDLFGPDNAANRVL